jgi:hypothetical protein
VAYRDWRASCVRHPLGAWVNAVSAADATALPIPHRIIFEAGTLAQQLVMSDPFSFRRLPERCVKEWTPEPKTLEGDDLVIGSPDGFLEQGDGVLGLASST